MNCYLCYKPNLRIIRVKLRHDIIRNVLQCQDCGIIYLEPKTDDLTSFYKEEYRKIYTPIIGTTLDSRQIFDIYLPYQQARVDLIKHELNDKMTVLDIGCSSGHFLYTIKPYVKEAIGIEFNKENADFVNKKLGIKVYTSSIEDTDIPFHYFDLITVFQVLEHIPDPIEFLKTISKYLKPNGLLYLEVPNINDALISVYNIEAYKDFWFREPHLFYYSPATLTLLLEKVQFKGNVGTIQTYNFINHLHWILTEKPQKSVDMGMSIPILLNCESINEEITKTFNKFIRKVDDEYKSIVRKYYLGNAIVFIGRKI